MECFLLIKESTHIQMSEVKPIVSDSKGLNIVTHPKYVYTQG